MSIEYILITLQISKKGPFSGIVEFSSGAAMTTMIGRLGGLLREVMGFSIGDPEEWVNIVYYLQGTVDLLPLANLCSSSSTKIEHGILKNVN